MTREQVVAMQGREGGVDEEEQIRAKIVPFESIARITTDAPTLAITYMVEVLLEAKKIAVDFV
jgi:hypothetical protein